jgi:hypothetical protein
LILEEDSEEGKKKQTDRFQGGGTGKEKKPSRLEAEEKKKFPKRK